MNFFCKLNKSLINCISYLLFQEEPLHAYLYRGEAKFDELAVIFDPPACQVIMATNEEVWTYDIDALMALEYAPGGGDQVGNEAAPDQQIDLLSLQADVQLVPPNATHEEPIDAIPLQVIPSVHMIEISSSSSHSSQVNWWDYLDYMSESEGSSATDMSTANSFNVLLDGHRHTQIRKKKVAKDEDKGRATSTASNSPFGKKK